MPRAGGGRPVVGLNVDRPAAGVAALARAVTLRADKLLTVGGTVRLFAGRGRSVPSAELIEQVQKLLDPEQERLARGWVWLLLATC